MTSSVEGWIVSPRKSRRRPACFSRTRTSTPARANSSPSMIPAGPPPAMQHRTETLSAAMETTLQTSHLRCHCERSEAISPRKGACPHFFSLNLVPAMQKGNLQEQHEAIEGEEG